MDKTEKAAIRAINETMHDEIRAVLKRVREAQTYEEARDLMLSLVVDPDKLPPDLVNELGLAWNHAIAFPEFPPLAPPEAI
jgi:hypothetical protein